MRTILIAFLFALGLTTQAQAHAHLRVAEPPVGATIHAVPPAVVITFSEAVEPRFSSIVVVDARGHRVDRGDVHTAPDNGRRLSVGLKPLAPGRYTVTWRATSVDTHKTHGRYSFTIAP